MKITKSQLRQIINEVTRISEGLDGVDLGDKVRILYGPARGKTGIVEEVMGRTAHVAVRGKLHYVDISDLEVVRKYGM
jgi:transcription elongation factor